MGGEQSEIRFCDYKGLSMPTLRVIWEAKVRGDTKKRLFFILIKAWSDLEEMMLDAESVQQSSSSSFYIPHFPYRGEGFMSLSRSFRLSTVSSLMFLSLVSSSIHRFHVCFGLLGLIPSTSISDALLRT